MPPTAAFAFTGLADAQLDGRGADAWREFDVRYQYVVGRPGVEWNDDRLGLVVSTRQFGERSVATPGAGENRQRGIDHRRCRLPVEAQDVRSTHGGRECEPDASEAAASGYGIIGAGRQEGVDVGADVRKGRGGNGNGAGAKIIRRNNGPGDAQLHVERLVGLLGG